MDALVRAFRDWVLAQRIDGCQISAADDGGVLIEGPVVRGRVGFYEIGGARIVELRLERKSDGEACFFLHFELNDLGRAHELFGEMESALRDASRRETRHVLLCCTCGLTTTFFANKLNEGARGLGLNMDFAAKPIDVAMREGGQFSAVLLAPQVGYQRKALVAALPGSIVIELPGKLFGSYDVAGVLRLTEDALSGRHAVIGETRLDIRRDYDRTKCILALSYVHREDEPTLGYQVLDHGTIALSGLLVRRSFGEDSLGTSRQRCACRGTAWTRLMP